MAGPRVTIEFTEDDLTGVVAVMDDLAAAGDGSGWVNIGPALTDEEEARVPPRSGLAAWFSGRGPAAPLGTWMPPVTLAKPRAAQIGLEHGTGPNALLRLSDNGVPLPAGWIKRQDHAKHGIVADLPQGADHRGVVVWMLAAARALSPELTRSGRWLATVHDSV